MDSKELYIDKIDRSKIKVLYLAKYAPEKDTGIPPIHKTDGIQPRYHYEIFKILTELGFQVFPSRDFKSLFSDIKQFDYVFSLYSQAPFLGSEIFVSSVCEYFSVPYLGASPHVRALVEDKHMSKIFAQYLRIPTPKWALYRAKGPITHPPSFKGPYILKPRFGAFSEGITEDSIQDEWEKILPLLETNLDKYGDAIVEEFIPGTNVTIPIIGSHPPINFKPVFNHSTLPGELESFEQKRFFDKTRRRVIYDDLDMEAQLQGYVSNFFQEAQPMDYMRVDFRIAYDRNKPMFLESNANGNLGSNSDICFPAKHVGISQKQVLLLILDYSFRRQNLFKA